MGENLKKSAIDNRLGVTLIKAMLAVVSRETTAFYIPLVLSTLLYGV